MRRILRNLFFIKRRPKLSIPAEWMPPTTKEAFEAMLDAEGFVSQSHWKETDLSQYATIRQDLVDLEEILLPTFFKHNQLAIHYQNRWFLYYWLLIVGIFLQLTLGVIAVYGFTTVFSPWEIWWLTSIPPIGALLASFLPLLALIGIGRGDTQKNWRENRSLAEELRSHYFRYLCHVYPYDTNNRLSRLRDYVGNLRFRQYSPSSRREGDDRGIRRSPHTAKDISVVYQLYYTKRLLLEENFCRRLVEEYRANLSFIYPTVIVTILVSILALPLGTSQNSPFLTCLPIPFVSIAALFILFRLLYTWDTSANLYEATLLGIEKLKFATYQDEISRSKPLPELVSEAESVIAQTWQHLRVSGSATPQLSTGLQVEPIFGPPPLNQEFECDVFMIMPFAAEFAPIYRDIIVPLVHGELRLNIKRGDDFFSEHSIMDEVWAGIYSSRLVIVECTGRNANVFYELGIAHTLGKSYIMIAQSIDDVPFDLRHLRTIVYQNTPDGLQALQGELKEAIIKLTSVSTIVE